MDAIIIDNMLVYEIVNTVIILAMIVAAFMFTVWAVKGEKRFKLVISITIAVSVIMMASMGIELTEVILDMKYEDYITYSGEYIQRGGGSKGMTTVVVYDDQGKEIKLLRTGPSETGVYEGTVIYGRRSKVVVKFTGSPYSDSLG